MMPRDIPQNPGRIYTAEWVSLDDWLGIGLQKMDFLSFEEAKKIVHRLRLESKEEWERYCESGRLPDNVPLNPRKAYKKEWKGWGDWLGTNVVANHKRKFRTYDDARDFVRKLGLDGQAQWKRYCKSRQIPGDIPTHPDRRYKNEGWPSENGWGDWLGSGNISTKAIHNNLIHKIKELLRDLIKSGIIYNFSDVRLYALLNSRGLLNLVNTNPLKQFFENLIEARKTVEGRKAIEEYAESNKRDVPDLSKCIENNTINAMTAGLKLPLNGSDPIEGDDKVRSPKQLMKEDEGMDSICVDDEMMQFQVTCSVQDKWNSAFQNENFPIEELEAKGLMGNKFHDRVHNTFLTEYRAVQKIESKLPAGYTFPFKPTLMQLFVSYKIKTNTCFANFSRTGSGKTLSAVLASRLIDSKMTIIVCPNDVVDQWKEVIIKTFPDSVVTKGKEAFNVKRDESQHRYLVLNYDKFSQDYSDNLILTLVEQKIDFLGLDEIHFVKKRDEADESQRHRRMKGLRKYISIKNKNVKVLAMSATPVINDLAEGKSLLEILTGKEYHDVSTRPTTPNAVNMYQKFMLLSVREKREYSHVKTHFLEVEAPKPAMSTIKQLLRSPLQIEDQLTEARIPEIIKHIDSQTIIYTEYVTGIIPKLEMAVKSAGYSYTLYTGKMKDLKPFIKGKVQVLIASRPVSVGVDELQRCCNRIIFNTLPWTNALYEQIIGRVDRIGQDKGVDIFVILASIGGFPYDKEIKWKTIQDKRTLTDCVVDGSLPRKDSATTYALKRHAEFAARQWLQRLEEGEVSMVHRGDLNVELIPSGSQQLLLFSDFERQRQINLSEFSRLNNIINNSKSETIHDKIQLEPQFLIEYNDKFDAAKVHWDIDPLAVIATKIRGLELPAHIITKYVIGDFGCGRARLADLQKENKVYSFDHHNILNDKIIACDIKSVPLKRDGQLDIAVFCLSLMEENWPDYIVEAKRCLTKNGLLFIAETTRSLSGRLYKLRKILEEEGFQKYADEEKGGFTFLEVRKL
jgi:superfamily II DNA or RNA helicase